MKNLYQNLANLTIVGFALTVWAYVHELDRSAEPAADGALAAQCFRLQHEEDQLADLLRQQQAYIQLLEAENDAKDRALEKRKPKLASVEQ
jgi:hypothetical protein